MAIMKSIRCFPLELNFTSTKSPTVLLNKNQIYIVCLPQHLSVGLSIYLSIYIFWAFISLQDLLRPFSNPCILSIMPHVFANTNFADIHFHSKIHLGQSLHTRKCNRKHRIEWNILQTHNIVKVKYAMTIARKCSTNSCFTMMIKIERLFIVDWTTTTTTTTMTMTTIHACARTSITLSLYIFFSFVLFNQQHMYYIGFLCVVW